jgi:hypothetical protein
VWDAVSLLNKFARIPVCGDRALRDIEPRQGIDRLPILMRSILNRPAARLNPRLR